MGRGSILPWEAALLESTGLPHISQLRYALSFLGAVIAGSGIRCVPSPAGRHAYAILTGLALVYYPFGNELLYALAPALATYAAILTIPQHCGTLAWAINLPYLFWCHAYNASTTFGNTGELDFTGGMMLVTLKLITLGVCRQAATTPQPPASEYRREHIVAAVPNPLEFLSYLTASGSLLGGPMYEYTEFQDFIHRRSVWASSAPRPMPSPVARGLWVFLRGLIFLAVYMVAERHFNDRLMASDWYAACSLPVKMGVLLGVCFTFRCKFYFVWSLGEAALVLAGFGFTGWDGDRPVWDRCQNVRIAAVETCQYGSLYGDRWNVQVSRFLRYYVYDALKPEGRKPGFLPLAVTQAVAGVWHGVYPGQLMFFAGTIFMFDAAKQIYRHEKRLPLWVQTSWAWSAIKWAISAGSLNFFGVAFYLVSWGRAYDAWKSVYFIPAIFNVIVSVGGGLLPTPRRPKERAGDRGEDQKGEGAVKKEL